MNTHKRYPINQLVLLHTHSQYLILSSVCSSHRFCRAALGTQGANAKRTSEIGTHVIRTDYNKVGTSVTYWTNLVLGEWVPHCPSPAKEASGLSKEDIVYIRRGL